MTHQVVVAVVAAVVSVFVVVEVVVVAAAADVEVAVLGVLIIPDVSSFFQLVFLYCERKNICFN